MKVIPRLDVSSLYKQTRQASAIFPVHYSDRPYCAISKVRRRRKKKKKHYEKKNKKKNHLYFMTWSLPARVKTTAKKKKKKNICIL